jgi:hypothetical protein
MRFPAATATMRYPRLPAPAMAIVRQDLPSDHIPDVRTDVREKLLGSRLGDSVKQGSRIAITAGSRGIGGFIELLAGIVDAVRSCGGEPFIIPAMGSHGGATAEGQTDILRLLGVTQSSVGAEVRATMETLLLGVSASGAAAHLDRFAAEADGIIVLGRTKTHPESAAELASGLLKMCTVGLGKQPGAQQAHNHGLWDSVRAVPRLQLPKSKILRGVAVVENGHRRPADIEVVQPSYDAFLDSDMRMLRIAKKYLAHIPFRELDLLIVDELGKTVSGAGMDPNVIGTWRVSGGPHEPDFKRIAVLSLTPASLGNGLGIGMADFTTRRFADAYDPAVTYINLLTASEPGGNTREGPLPLALASDREAIEVALYSSLPGPRPRVCRIRNTALLDEMWISEALLDDAAGLRVIEPAAPMAFDSAGNLFP